MYLPALTLIRPMGAAIVHGTKRIENRPRDLPKRMRGVPTIVAVHSGKKIDGDYWHTLRSIDGDNEGRVPYFDNVEDEGIVGLMLLSGRVFRGDDTLGFDTVSPWYAGPYGYEIAAAIPFPTPIPCRGMQGWWPVPNEIEAMISAADAYEDLVARAPADVRDQMPSAGRIA